MEPLAAPVQATREKLEQGLLAKFGEAFDKASQQAQSIMDPARRALGAARIALEHAVLQTALEKDMPSKSVASMLERASPQQVAHFIQEGRKSVQRSYGVDADAMVAALSAQVANVDLPKTMVQTESLRQLVERGRALVHQTVLESYQTRGQVQLHAARSDHLTAQQTAAGATARDQLKTHMVFVESAIDWAARSGQMAPQQAAMLKERVEHQVFHAPADTKLSADFQRYYEGSGRALRQDIMGEARKITTNRTVGEIAERLHEARERVERMRPQLERQ